MQFSGRKRFPLPSSGLRGVSNKKGMTVTEDEGSMKGVGSRHYIQVSKELCWKL